VDPAQLSRLGGGFISKAVSALHPFIIPVPHAAVAAERRPRSTCGRWWDVLVD
jgi:hypothetical protein